MLRVETAGVYYFSCLTGNLKVYQTPISGSINDGVEIFTVSGQRTTATEWLKQEIVIPNTVIFKIAFEATTGLPTASDIAIDDITISTDTGKYVILCSFRYSFSFNIFIQMRSNFTK